MKIWCLMARVNFARSMNARAAKGRSETGSTTENPSTPAQFAVRPLLAVVSKRFISISGVSDWSLKRHPLYMRFGWCACDEVFQQTGILIAKVLPV